MSAKRKNLFRPRCRSATFPKGEGFDTSSHYIEPTDVMLEKADLTDVPSNRLLQCNIIS